MSTRANYIFKSGRKTLTTFYIHHDGYPEGAAEYFQNALIYGDGKLNDPDTFLRANEDCEISEIHGDIEYLYEYNIKTQTISCYKVSFEDGKMSKVLYIKDDVYMFVSRFYTIFSGNEQLREYKAKGTWRTDKELEQRILKENTWVYIFAKDRYDLDKKLKPKCLRLIYNQLAEVNQEIRDKYFDWGPSNPNFTTLEVWQYKLMQQAEEVYRQVTCETN